MAEAQSAPKMIQQIQVGVVGDKVGWILDYQQGGQESFALHLPIAKKFYAALEACITSLEQQATRGMHDSMRLEESAAVRLQPPG